MVEDRKEKNPTFLITFLLHSQKCMFKVTNISAMYKVCSALIIRHQDIDEVTLPFV